VWTKQAEDSFNATIDYLLQIWTVKEATNFIDLVEAVIAKIEINPKLFKVSIFDKESREAIITKHTSMFYRLLNNNTIEIEYFWNNYKNPKNIKSTVKDK
jgi:plasmid stabilization system protein ParE